MNADTRLRNRAFYLLKDRILDIQIEAQTTDETSASHSDGARNVKIGLVWFDDATDRDLDIGTEFARKGNIAWVRMTRPQFDEALSAADYDADAFGPGGAERDRFTRRLGDAAVRVLAALRRQVPEWVND